MPKLMRLGGGVVLGLALALSSEITNAAPASSQDLLYMTQMLGPMTRPSSSRHVCGESPYRLTSAATGGMLGALGAGALTGMAIGKKCDVALLGMTFGACTLAATLVGGATGALLAAETSDLITGWRDCSGMVYLTPDNEIAMQLGADSHMETLEISARRNARVLALFDDYVNRCGAAVRTPRTNGRDGRPFVGIGSTASAAEMVAVTYCQKVMGEDEQCDVILPGACNSWH